MAACVFITAIACHRETRGDRVADQADHEKVSRANAERSASGAAAGEPLPVSVPMRARAHLTALAGASIAGHAKFFQQPEGVLVVLEVKDAPPGKKGVHVHTHGDCSDPKKESMGPHFAPKLEQHALPSEGSYRHLGDLGNIDVAADGKGRLEIKVPNATLGADDSTTFLGRSLVVHSGEDTGSPAQPAGNSGAPLACGVIREEGS